MKFNTNVYNNFKDNLNSYIINIVNLTDKLFPRFFFSKLINYTI